MFQKLAKVRGFELWLATPRRKVVRSQVVACNDNRPGIVRPGGWDVHPRRSRAGRLACRWSLSRNGQLTCRWEFEADGSSGGQRSAAVAGPQFVPSGDPMNARKAVAG
jgi:hypothetical protein